MNADGTNLYTISNQPYSNHPICCQTAKVLPMMLMITGMAGGKFGGNIRLGATSTRSISHMAHVTPGCRWTVQQFRCLYPYHLVLLSGQLVLDRVYLDAVYSNNNHVTVRLNNNDTEWYPDWQTEDNQRPITRVQSLSSVSPAPYTSALVWFDAGLVACAIMIFRCVRGVMVPGQPGKRM